MRAGTPPLRAAMLTSMAPTELQKSGFTDEEIVTMIVANSRLLAGPELPGGSR